MRGGVIQAKDQLGKPRAAKNPGVPIPVVDQPGQLSVDLLSQILTELRLLRLGMIEMSECLEIDPRDVPVELG